MKLKIKIEKDVEVKLLYVVAKVRYWEDSELNGESDTEGKMPCRDKENWCPAIEIETGKIIGWPQGTAASIHYKVVDCCGWSLKEEETGEAVLFQEDGCVPATLCPKEEGYGDNITMDIDENGIIADWNFDIRDFQNEEE